MIPSRERHREICGVMKFIVYERLRKRGSRRGERERRGMIPSRERHRERRIVIHRRGERERREMIPSRER